jgi:hypothetical protein
MVSDGLEDYFNALKRLRTGNTVIVKKGTKITNDSVSLEAGRQKGSIKKSRKAFASLITEIEEAAEEQIRPKVDQAARLSKEKDKSNTLQERLDAALAREMSLVYELFEIKKQLTALSGEKIVPIRRSSKVKKSGGKE